MLDGLFVTPALTAIAEALESARITDGTLAVVGNAKLAAALAAAHRDVVPVALSARAAKRHKRAIPDLSSIADRSLAAVIGVDVTLDAAWERTLGEWTRVVRGDGAIVFVDRGRAPEASRRALCIGLAELEQRRAGRAVITSGRRIGLWAG